MKDELNIWKTWEPHLNQTSDLIEQIRGQNPFLADTLRRYVDDFEYERILMLLQKAVSQNGKRHTCKTQEENMVLKLMKSEDGVIERSEI